MNGDLAAEIRRAAALGEFVTARRLWDKYAGSLQVAIQTGSASAEMMEEARRTIEWCRLEVKAFRAQAARSLSGARIARIYRGEAEMAGSRYIRTTG